MKTLLVALFLTVATVSHAEELGAKLPRDPSKVTAKASYKCMNWLDTGVMKIKKSTNKASFSNGYVKFDKKAKINAMLSMPADIYCVGDRLVFMKTFGSRPAKIEKIDIN